MPQSEPDQNVHQPRRGSEPRTSSRVDMTRRFRPSGAGASSDSVHGWVYDGQAERCRSVVQAPVVGYEPGQPVG